MRNTLLKVFSKFRSLRDSEESQDLVEYGLLISLIALLSVTILDMGGIGGAVQAIYVNIKTSLA